jgi:hypothetical protein
MAMQEANRIPAPPASMASRFRQRLFHPWSGPRAPAPSSSPSQLPAPVAKRKITFQASIAEFLLVNRLRARRRAQPSADVMERAARIVFVTCQNWFAKPGRGGPDHRSRL